MNNENSSETKNNDIGLVLCGGGVYGSVLLGALESMQLVKLNIRIIVGTSSGAIIGTLLCVGYTPREILEIVKSNLPVISTDSIDIARLFSEYGLYSNVKFIEVVTRMIEKKTNGIVPTFSQLYDMFEKKELIITGTNVSTQSVAYFNRTTSPDMSVMDALKISTCIPFVFPYVRYDGDVYVDGGLTDNLPTEYANEYMQKHMNENITLHTFNLKYTYPVKPTSLLNFVMCIMKLFANGSTSRVIQADKQWFTHNVPVNIICSFTTVNPKDIEALFQCGLEYKP